MQAIYFTYSLTSMFVCLCVRAPSVIGASLLSLNVNELYWIELNGIEFNYQYEAQWQPDNAGCDNV